MKTPVTQHQNLFSTCCPEDWGDLDFNFFSVCVIVETPLKHHLWQKYSQWIDLKTNNNYISKESMAYYTTPYATSKNSILS